MGGSEAGVAQPGSSGRIFFQVLKKVPSGGRQPSPAGPGAGCSLQGRKFPGTRPASQRDWYRGVGWRAAAATPGPGAGRRWLPLARLRAGRRWRRLRPRQGGGGEEGCGAKALAASRLGAREEDEEEGAAVAAAAELWARQAMSSGSAGDPAVAGRL